MADLCGMCEDAPAVSDFGRWPVPVCDDCDRWLVGTQAELDRMEAEDPNLKELGRRVNESTERWIRERHKGGPINRLVVTTMFSRWLRDKRKRRMDG